jgi:CDP-diacylglycerol---glycerol-3-phosphate 3-phosphatidyltransferase
MNLPNRLSLIRLIMVAPFILFIYVDSVYARLLALLIFIAAGVTDLYDGYLARKYNLITPLGVFLDPLADKLIVTAAFICFVELPELHVPAWMVVLIVGREFVMTGLRSLAAAEGEIIAADEGGKFKTSVQVTAILTILVVLIVNSSLSRFWQMSLPSLHASPGWRAMAARLMEWTPYWMMFIATVFSLVTGISYLRKYQVLLRKNA